MLERCPLTKKEIKDPVIADDGITYERSAIKEYINKNHQKGPVASPVTYEILNNYNLRPAPDTKLKEAVRRGYCPLTKKEMEDPVIAADDVSYERSAIEQYINYRRGWEPVVSPVTHEILKNYNLRPNTKLKEEIDSKPITAKVSKNIYSIFCTDPYWDGYDQHTGRDSAIVFSTYAALSIFFVATAAYLAETNSKVSVALMIAGLISGALAPACGLIRCGIRK